MQSQIEKDQVHNIWITHEFNQVYHIWQEQPLGISRWEESLFSTYHELISQEIDEAVKQTIMLVFAACWARYLESLKAVESYDIVVAYDAWQQNNKPLDGEWFKFSDQLNELTLLQLWESTVQSKLSPEAIADARESINAIARKAPVCRPVLNKLAYSKGFESRQGLYKDPYQV